jgi:hypothetical protein
MGEEMKEKKRTERRREPEIPLLFFPSAANTAT